MVGYAFIWSKYELCLLLSSRISRCMILCKIKRSYILCMEIPQNLYKVYFVISILRRWSFRFRTFLLEERLSVRNDEINYNGGKLCCFYSNLHSSLFFTKVGHTCPILFVSSFSFNVHHSTCTVRIFQKSTFQILSIHFLLNHLRYILLITI